MLPTTKRLRRYSRSSLPITAAMRVHAHRCGLHVFVDELEIDVLERVAAFADREQIGAGCD